ncbi:hypothetical protein [Xylophilus sp. GOD-11R]|uniref:hypothetical protein n=1 Tax=Xylophilus sp. GOD-11R TaxID=3089814 RepID=UPI00298D1DF8|nr:hypothetical protein [Xylophilus sp. GOD-11R]WPB57009.1 hypothetical protein R9X41_23235 [Xylophilus sp. GOD-11R]
MPVHRRATRISLIALVVVAALAGAAAVAIPSEAELARRAEAALSDKLRVPVHIGRLHWALLPEPLVEVFDVRTDQPQPIVLEHLAAWPRLGALLHGEIAFRLVRLDGATLPQPSFKAFKGVKPPGREGSGPFELADLPVERAEFSRVTWLGRRPVPLEFHGHADFDPQWRPRQAVVARTGVNPPAQVDLHRLDGQDRWKADIAVADGSWNGTLALQQPAADRWRVTGEFDPERIDLRLLLQAFQRRPVLAGRAAGHTTLEAEGATPGEIGQSLRTSTRFSVAQATVLRFDLDRAIRSLGKEHAGTTPLDALSGVLDTQNDPDGIVMRYRDLKARSGKLSASGEVTLQNRRIDADFAVDLVDGIVGVPLRITGPVTDPVYSVPPGALAGAAAGTAVLPGVGTAIGARIGDAIGRLFGGSGAAPARQDATPKKSRPAPYGPPSTR